MSKPLPPVRETAVLSIDAYRAEPSAERFGPTGYPGLLGLRNREPLSLVGQVNQGFAYQTVERFQRRTGLTAAEVARLIQVPQRTLTRRKVEGRLAPEESDRLLRAARVVAAGVDLFEGNVVAARHWLTTGHPALGGGVPVDLATTDVGAREVEALIGRLEHGIPS
ncbi:MAG: antitoxin Xre/MbcA/ParS toxin-binding domain-containing protein [Gemmatimonadota bacterium]